jgi:hypothetical protein
MVSRKEIYDSEEFADIFAYFADGTEEKIWCGTGWSDLIRKCHDELFAKDPLYRVVQVKEKFGRLRYYFTPSDMKKYAEMSSIVLKYETESSNTCDVCGLEGYISSNYRIMEARCDEHRSEDYRITPTFQDLGGSLPEENQEQEKE